MYSRIDKQKRERHRQTDRGRVTEKREINESELFLKCVWKI